MAARLCKRVATAIGAANRTRVLQQQRDFACD
jgi:hypothetical protein